MSVVKIILLLVEFGLDYLREQKIKDKLDAESLKRVDALLGRVAAITGDGVSDDDPDLFREETPVRDSRGGSLPTDQGNV